MRPGLFHFLDLAYKHCAFSEANGAMKVIRARVYGYCMGVRRAVDTAISEAKSLGAGGIFTMGPLIHNPQALDSLRSLGVGVLDERNLPERLDGATVVIRAHGVPPQLVTSLSQRGARVVDATCPRVRSSQRRAAAYSERGFSVFLAGERAHGEVVGVASYAKDCIVVASGEEAREAAGRLFAESPSAKTVLIGQTTLTAEEYASIAREIERFFPALETIDSICPATSDRQAALDELCAEADAVVVVGGRTSANTRRLYSAAVQRGKPAWHVESPDELTGEVAAELGAFSVVGLTAGASTPDEVIVAVEKRLLSLALIEQKPTIS
jgi:4-hydroxy-3-methylbut-2-enyl diphosphate reductase